MSSTPRTGVLTVDLAAVQANWRTVKARLTGGADAGAVIKADAYGLGADRVGPALYRAGCREFFVATLAEARAARRYLPESAVIRVFGGVAAGDEAEFLRLRLQPVLFTLPDMRRWAAHCRAVGTVAPSALKLDTGMNRLGLSAEEFRQCLSEPEALCDAGVELFLSHLACAEDTSSPLNGQQQQRFTAAAAQMRERLPQVRLSLANSAGVFLGEPWQFDLVRPGSALYGFNPQPDAANPMRQAVQLKLPILQVRDIVELGTVGYGGSEAVAPPARLATVAGGYADGLNRLLGRHGQGYIGEEPVPVAGRISMDLTVFDITRAAASGESGEWVEILNQHQTINTLTESVGALGYEVLTSLKGRYERHYLPEEADA